MRRTKIVWRWALVFPAALCVACDSPTEAGSTPIPPYNSGEFVTFPSQEIEAVLGPQLRSGSKENPWPWFDSNALEKGLQHGGEFPTQPPTAGTDYYVNLNYYDQGLAQYLNYYRTGDAQFLTLARKITDSWYPYLLYNDEKGWGTAPRNSSLGGVILRALDGQPEMWPWITDYTRKMFQMWVGARVTYDDLYYGVRDGGYMLIYAAWLAQVHPDAAVRAEFRDKALQAARDYYARLQSVDGGWYWKDDSEPWEQPFMVGLLLEGMVEVHEMSNDPAVEQAILKSVAHLYVTYRKSDEVPERPGAFWRSVPYFVFPDGRTSGETNLAGGWDTNTIREGRQRNSLLLHAFGYAYRVAGDTKYLQWGDEIFASTYGKGEGPHSDPYYGLADFRAKEYNQAYRSAGRYLAWRLQ